MFSWPMFVMRFTLNCHKSVVNGDGGGSAIEKKMEIEMEVGRV